MPRIAVMGSGSWGPVSGMVLADAGGGDVAMWAANRRWLRTSTIATSTRCTTRGLSSHPPCGPARGERGSAGSRDRGARDPLADSASDNLSAWKRRSIQMPHWSA